MSEPKIFIPAEEAISRFLWDEASQPTNIKDEKYIRPHSAKGRPVEIDATEYMVSGGGADLYQLIDLMSLSVSLMEKGIFKLIKLTQ